MRTLILETIKKLDRVTNGFQPEDWLHLRDECQAAIQELEQEALARGRPGVVRACQRPCGTAQDARAILAACLEECAKPKPKSELEPELLTVAQAASKFGLGERTLYRLVEQGKIPSRRIGRAIRIKPSDLERCLEAPTESLFD